MIALQHIQYLSGYYLYNVHCLLIFPFYLFWGWLQALPYFNKCHHTTALKGVQRPVLEQAYQYNIYMVPLKSDYVWVQLT